jgi:hypothetical protein
MRTVLRSAAHFAVAMAAIVSRPACSLAEDAESAAIDRAVAFLAAEVPKWKQENHCYSCHNNGDAVRALLQAHDAGRLNELAPIDDTITFLATPEKWDANGPDGPFKDLKLQRIQFGAALAEAHATRVLDNRAAWRKAAKLVAENQSPEGCWDTDAPGTVGSPVTYGRALATALAAKMLSRSGGDFSHEVDNARHWFEVNEPKNVLDAAATILGLAGEVGEAVDKRRQQCLALVREGQSSDGGCGPFVNSPPDVFDTAVVVIALSEEHDNTHAKAIRRGREYLLAQQEADGGWPATTRPPGVDSYAQRISTTGWALLALLASE